MAEYEDEPLHLPLTKNTPVGTKVICVDDDNGYLFHIREGKVYIIDCFDGAGYVYVKNYEKDKFPSGGWLLSRFEIA